MPVSSVSRPGRAPHVVAATLAAVLTWGLFSAVVSIGAHDRERLMLANAARQGTPVIPVAAAAVPTPEAPMVVAAAGASR
jgi:hypothetical protein